MQYFRDDLKVLHFCIKSLHLVNLLLIFWWVMTRDSNGYVAMQIWLTAKEKYFGWLSRLKWLKLQLILRLAMTAIPAVMAITANFVIDFVTLQAVFYVESEKKQVKIKFLQVSFIFLCLTFVSHFPCRIVLVFSQNQ